MTNANSPLREMGFAYHLRRCDTKMTFHVLRPDLSFQRFSKIVVSFRRRRRTRNPRSPRRATPQTATNNASTIFSSRRFAARRARFPGGALWYSSENNSTTASSSRLLRLRRGNPRARARSGVHPHAAADFVVMAPLEIGPAHLVVLVLPQQQAGIVLAHDRELTDRDVLQSLREHVAAGHRPKQRAPPRNRARTSNNSAIESRSAPPRLPSNDLEPELVASRSEAARRRSSGVGSANGSRRAKIAVSCASDASAS